MTMSIPFFSAANNSNNNDKDNSDNNPNMKAITNKLANISNKDRNSQRATTCFFVDAEGLLFEDESTKKRGFFQSHYPFSFFFSNQNQHPSPKKDTKTEKKRNRFSVQVETPPRSPSPRPTPSHPSSHPTSRPPPRPKRASAAPQVIRVYLDDGDSFIVKAGFPLSFSVRLDEKMRSPELRFFFFFFFFF